MSTQTVFKAGNSNVLSIPKELGLKPGDKVLVQPGLTKGSFFVQKADKKIKSPTITPDFLNILQGINKRYGKALAELATK